MLTLLRAVVSIGLLSPRRRLFWRFLWRAATRAPHSFAWAVARTAVGEHMVRYTEEQVLSRIEAALQQLEVERRAEAEDLSSVASVARQAVAAR